ncbi:MAG TPA: PA2169 family four-helix-bundle protein [Blastocatellia bacterium]|nr:PA2169 family four-helix-bundle protein [Blastocatellia bacterium]
MDNDKVIGILNNLVETCRDGQYGFKEAAENATGSDLKRFFSDASLERARFVGELQRQVQILGGDPEKSGSTAGAMHRTWINVKGTLTGKDDESILTEAERGEDSAMKAYEDALKQALPANCKTMVEAQYIEVKQAHDRVKRMRDARSATAGSN